MNVPKFNLAALKYINLAQITSIAKQRGVLIGSVLVIVLAPLAAWWFRTDLTDEIAQKMSQRVKDFDSMEKLRLTDVSFGGQSIGKVSLNSTIINALRDRNVALEIELKGMYQAAIDYNQKHHDFIALKDNQGIPLKDSQGKEIIFPNSDQNDKLVLDEIYFPLIIPAYQALLDDNRTGQAPDSLAVLEAVQRRSSDFILSDLKKKPSPK